MVMGSGWAEVVITLQRVPLWAGVAQTCPKSPLIAASELSGDDEHPSECAYVPRGYRSVSLVPWLCVLDIAPRSPAGSPAPQAQQAPGQRGAKPPGGPRDEALVMGRTQMSQNQTFWMPNFLFLKADCVASDFPASADSVEDLLFDLGDANPLSLSEVTTK